MNKMFDIEEYRKLEALGKATVTPLPDGSVLIEASYSDEFGNPKPKEIGRVTLAELDAEAQYLEARAADYRALAGQIFSNGTTLLKGMTRLEFLWGRFTTEEIVGAYQLSLNNGAVLAFLQAIAMSTPDDFGRYVVLQHPLVLLGVPMVLNALEQAGVIGLGQASIRAAQVLDSTWTKSA